MATPRECFEEFLSEKARIYADVNVRLEPLLSRYFGEPLLQRAGDFLLSDRQVVEEVKESGATLATIITRVGLNATALRRRYHLKANGDSWKITRVDRVCFVCAGSGRSGKDACPVCNGEGWCDGGEKVR